MNSSSPQISIIIPSYNRAKYICSAIDSVLNQKTDYSYEIIVVDDGSNDDTERLLSDSKYRGIQYLKIPHSGLPAVARNHGLEHAKGELIAFQDSDDEWAEDKLNLQVPVFKDKEIILAYGNAEIMDESGNHTGQSVVDPSVLADGESFEGLINENTISTLTVMVRKAALIKAGGFNESPRINSVEDYHLWLRLSLAGKFQSLPKTLAYYRRHSQNISPASTLVSAQRLINLNKLLLKEVPGQKPLIKQRLERLYADCARLSRFPMSIIYNFKRIMGT